MFIFSPSFNIGITLSKKKFIKEFTCIGISLIVSSISAIKSPGVISVPLKVNIFLLLSFVSSKSVALKPSPLFFDVLEV